MMPAPIPDSPSRGAASRRKKPEFMTDEEFKCFSKRTVQLQNRLEAKARQEEALRQGEGTGKEAKEDTASSSPSSDVSPPTSSAIRTQIVTMPQGNRSGPQPLSLFGFDTHSGRFPTRSPDQLETKADELTDFGEAIAALKRQDTDTNDELSQLKERVRDHFARASYIETHGSSAPPSSPTHLPAAHEDFTSRQQKWTELRARFPVMQHLESIPEPNAFNTNKDRKATTRGGAGQASQSADSIDQPFPVSYLRETRVDNDESQSQDKKSSTKGHSRSWSTEAIAGNDLESHDPIPFREQFNTVHDLTRRFEAWNHPGIMFEDKRMKSLRVKTTPEFRRKLVNEMSAALEAGPLDGSRPNSHGDLREEDLPQHPRPFSNHPGILQNSLDMSHRLTLLKNDGLDPFTDRALVGQSAITRAENGMGFHAEVKQLESQLWGSEASIAAKQAAGRALYERHLQRRQAEEQQKGFAGHWNPLLDEAQFSVDDDGYVHSLERVQENAGYKTTAVKDHLKLAPKKTVDGAEKVQISSPTTQSSSAQSQSEQKAAEKVTMYLKPSVIDDVQSLDDEDDDDWVNLDDDGTDSERAQSPLSWEKWYLVSEGTGIIMEARRV